MPVHAIARVRSIDAESNVDGARLSIRNAVTPSAIAAIAKHGVV